MTLRKRLHLYRLRVTRVYLLSALYVRNVLSRASITSETGPIVSLTSHGTRLATVFATIESIGRGSILPSEIILWVDNDAVFESPSRTLRRLKKRGLKVQLCENFGPHTKYYPFITSRNDFTAALVTADDDQFYARDWLKALVNAAEREPDAIHCHRAHIVSLTEDGDIDLYDRWSRSNTTEANPRVFATGVSGVIYPPAFLKFLKEAGEQFKDVAPRADDIWLHACALRGGYHVHQVAPDARHYLEVPFSQGVALRRSNVDDGANDRQIVATYSESDLEKLRSATTYTHTAS